MKRKILIESFAEQIRVAVLEDGQLVEYYVERPGKERVAGNIYNGIVVDVLPGMDAAFVDIGLEKNAFLYVGDILSPGIDEASSDHQEELPMPSIRQLLHVGQRLLVQVVKDPVGTKGARITTHITLPGHYAVLIPTLHHIGISRRIENESERDDLKEMIKRILDNQMGAIVRSAGQGFGEDVFRAELDDLQKLWQQIEAASKRAGAPELIHRDSDLIFRMVRDCMNEQIDEMVVEGKAAFEHARRAVEWLVPALGERVRQYTGNDNLFAFYNLEVNVDKIYQSKVWLKNGGYLIIDQTEALTVIDVNTGRYIGGTSLEKTILKNNMEASRKIARELRLRDIGGIVIIDFIDMIEPENRQTVVEALREELRKDRSHSNVVGMTGLGLVEMTRKKLHPDLNAITHIPCPYCGGKGKILTPESVALNVYRQYLQLRKKSSKDGARYQLRVHSDVAACLQEEGLLPADEVDIQPTRQTHAEHFTFTAIENG